MNANQTHPDCGATAEVPHRDDGDVAPRSGCGAMLSTCASSSPDPLKVVGDGERHAPDGTADGFVIYDYGAAPPVRQTPPPQQQVDLPPAYPDHVRERNARLVFENCYVEPVFSGGLPTGEFRAGRRRLQGGSEVALFSTQEAALDWAKRRHRG